MIGQKFNMLTVVEGQGSSTTPKGTVLPYWKCLCECGAHVKVLQYNLTTDKVKSCGCLRRENSSRTKSNLYGKDYFELEDGTKVHVDPEDIPKINRMFWYLDKDSNTIRGTKANKKYLITKLVADILGEKGKSVRFITPDHFDVRKGNLVVLNSTNKKVRAYYSYATSLWEDRPFYTKREKEIRAREVVRLNKRFNLLKAHANTKGGSLLATEYTSVTEKLPFMCAKGHKFYSSYDSVMNSGHWCKVCGNAISEGEEFCRSFLEKILGVELKTSRPKWLVNDLTGNLLELDGYSEDLGVAFEHQGMQHYEPHPIFHDTTSLEEIQRRDGLKLRRCSSRGTLLIQVPAVGKVLTKKEAETYMLTKLKKHRLERQGHKTIDRVTPILTEKTRTL